MAISKIDRRRRKKYSIRHKVKGTEKCPRLTISKTCQHIYIQIIDDEKGVTLCSASTLDKVIKNNLSEKDKSRKNFCNINYAKKIAELLSNRAKEKNISKIVFDRNGYLYHGRVKVISEICREKGLIF